MSKDMNSRIPVVVTEEQKRTIEDKARKEGLSTSAYLRLLGLSHRNITTTTETRGISLAETETRWERE